MIKALKRVLFITCFIFSLVGCNLINGSQENEPIARVNDDFLYKEDLKGIVPVDLNKVDSSLFVNAYINSWARRRLLMEGAQRNISEEKQQEYEVLIDQYRTDLFTKSYLDGLILQSMDTIVYEKEATQFYELNKESFKLNESLIRLRYVNMSQNALNSEEVKERIIRFDSLDQPYLDSIAIQFNSYSLKDSIWVRLKDVVTKIPVINSKNESELLKISNFIQLKDSINLYLIKVVAVRNKNEYAPLAYVLPSIEQMVLNKRKLELTKQLEKDIIKDAIKTNEFEIYE